MVVKLLNFGPELELFVGTTLETELGAEVACASSSVFLLDHFADAVHSTAMQKLHRHC